MKPRTESRAVIVRSMVSPVLRHDYAGQAHHGYLYNPVSEVPLHKGGCPLSNATPPGLLDTVSSLVIRFLDYFIHKYEPDVHDRMTFILYT